MYCTRKITEGITWIGGSDRRLALFENLFPIPRGVARPLPSIPLTAPFPASFLKTFSIP